MGQTREALYMTHTKGQKIKGQGHKVSGSACVL